MSEVRFTICLMLKPAQKDRNVSGNGNGDYKKVQDHFLLII